MPEYQTVTPFPFDRPPPTALPVRRTTALGYLIVSVLRPAWRGGSSWQPDCSS